MKHGLIEVVAYQETLLIMAVFGIVVLAMLWVGFRRWLHAKERTDRLLREQTAEQSSQFGAYIERVEARLKAIENMMAEANIRAPTQIERSTDPQAFPSASRDPAPR